MTKTFRFVSFNTHTQKIIRLIWDEEQIYVYTETGNVELTYKRSIGPYDIIFLARSAESPITNLYYRPVYSVNHVLKCLLHYDNELYKPDTLRTKKRFLKHVDLIKTTK